MGKTAKRMKYIDGKLPEDLGVLLSKADESDLKILIALMMAADENGIVGETFSVSTALGLEKAEVAAAIKFWRGAGIIESVTQTAKAPAQTAEKKVTQQKPAEKKAEKATIETAHRGGALESSNEMGNYGSGQLAGILEKRQGFYEFLEEAQRVYGKIFSAYDTGIVVRLIEELGFEEEAVLSILAYTTKLGKKGLRYTEKVALSFYDEGYTTYKEVHAYIELIEQSKEVIYKVKQLFGATNRELSKSENAMFEKWTRKFGYDIDVIKMAYDITIDIKHEPIPKYTSAILENWYNEGLRTVEEISAHEEAKKSAKENKNKGEGDNKSYDLDDFFEAALKRSFDDLK